METNVEKITLVADFETTTKTDHTRVWSAAYMDLDDPCSPDYVFVRTNIDDFLGDLFRMDCDVDCWFHNLRFDGSFILSWLLRNDKFDELSLDGKLLNFRGKKGKELMRDFDYTYIYSVSDMGVWYSITIVYNGHLIKFLDSAKLLPFTLAEIGKAFGTKYQKLEMDYSSHDCEEDIPITAEEMDYIKNDCLVLQQAMSIMKEQGFDKTTIGSCCRAEFKKGYGSSFKSVFPDLTKVDCPFEKFQSAHHFTQKAYHGGWCYCRPDRANKIQRNGITADVNSLYPSVLVGDPTQDLHYPYPYGYPTWFEGEIPEKALSNAKYYFVWLKCHFDIKPDHLPTIQLKGNHLYKSNEWLTTNRVEGERFYIDVDGKIQSAKVEMVMTQTDFELFQKHYDLDGLEILGGCYFDAAEGLFDEYINYWKEQKIKATIDKNKVLRQISKLMLNSIYGGFAMTDNDSYSMFTLGENGQIVSHTVESHEKQVVYMPVGAVCTAYARNFTITAAQLNYDKFCYADTDSIHLAECTADEVLGAPMHPTEFCHWAYEATWDEAIFVRQKTYIEHNIEEDLEPLDEPYYNIKCAGMGKKPKELLAKQLESGEKKLTDFKVGLELEGNLKAKRVDGGTVLVENNYKMR